MRSALMLTGVTTRKECEYTEFKPTWIAEDYLELEKLLFGKQALHIDKLLKKHF
jgi:ribonucleotide monophosphatase NagD (HAD superfamily)